MLGGFYSVAAKKTQPMVIDEIDGLWTESRSLPNIVCPILQRCRNTSMGGEALCSELH